MNEKTAPADRSRPTDEQQAAIELLAGMIDRATRCSNGRSATADTPSESDESAATAPQPDPRK